jgi:hypothetical protein
MSRIDRTPAGINSDERIDLREQPYNQRDVGADRAGPAPDRPEHDAPRHRHRSRSGPVPRRHPAGYQRDTGRGLHVIIWFDDLVKFNTDGDRRRWAGIVEAVQAALPIDPDQPGITALTRPADPAGCRPY